MTLLIEDFIRQRLGDRDTVDYFPASGELTGIIWRFVVCRNMRLTLPLITLETRMTPLLTPGVSLGTFWAYTISNYTPSIYYRILSCCAFDSTIHQPSHKYALFQANAYVDDVYEDPQPEIDEIGLTADFPAAVTGAVSLTGYIVNINRLMFDIFTAIANDEGKLAIYQSTLGGAVDLRQAAQAAQREAGNWLRGTIVSREPLKGARRRFYNQ